jgi:tRNA (cytosine38-C5)-methyltransferase
MHAVYKEFNKQDRSQTDRVDRPSVLSTLKLRYFTPREVANLLCFPQYFEFPDSLSDKQKYRLLGNSLNVQVVTKLLRILLFSNL